MRLYRPKTVAGALSCLEDDPRRPRFYAGGVEVVFALRGHTFHGTSLIDTKLIDGSVGVSHSDGQVRIGPATKHHMLATNLEIRSELRLLALACESVGTAPIRMQGTLGGNFAYGHQHTDPGTASVVYGGSVELESTSGRRSVPLDEFWTGPYQVVCGPGELIESIWLQPLGTGWKVVHDRVEQLHRPPTAIVSMAARITADRVGECRIVAGGVPPRPTRLRSLEDTLAGCPVEDLPDALNSAEYLLEPAVAARSDLLGSSEFKIVLLAGLIRRAAKQLVG